MSYGVSHHIRGVHTGGELAALGLTCAIINANQQWTTFAVIDSSDFDAESVARELGSAIVQIWSDDDDGRALSICASDGWSAQLTAEVGSVDDSSLPPEDGKLLDELVRRGILTETQQAALKAGLTREPTARNAWIATNGIEQALGVASAMSLPWPCPTKLFAELVAGVTVIPAAPPNKRKRKRTKHPATASRPLPAAPSIVVDPAVVALHVHYWTKIFEMNNWSLHKRYKRHLPAERRREADELIDLLAGSHWNPPIDEVFRRVEAILAAVWHADDWDAAIRDPSIIEHEPLTPERRAEWQHLIGARPAETSTAN